MPKKQLFRSEHLLSLYKKGQLKKIMKIFNIESKKWIGAGSQASTFMFNDQEVVKICSKKIPYFSENPKGTAVDFQKCINNLHPFFIPINKILYENEDLFIYTQDLCQSFGKDIWEPQATMNIFELVVMLLQNNLSIIDIAPRNIGLYKGHAAILDPHGIRSVIPKEQQWFKNIIDKFLPILSTLQNLPVFSDSSALSESTTQDVGFSNKLKSEVPTTDIGNMLASLSRVFLEAIDNAVYNANKSS